MQSAYNMYSEDKTACFFAKTNRTMAYLEFRKGGIPSQSIQNSNVTV